MKTILECGLFLEAWKCVLSENDLSQVRSFLGSIGLSGDGIPTIPRAQNLNDNFLRWFQSDYEVLRFDRIYHYVGDRACVGIVRNVNRRTGEILLYCDYDYTSKILRLDDPTITMGHMIRPATESEYKRLRRELGRVGMVWKDKLHRLEPLKVKADLGSTYWYINDQLRIVSAREDHGKTAHMRYIAGNYFTDYGKSLEICDKIREILKSGLVKNG